MKKKHISPLKKKNIKKESSIPKKNIQNKKKNDVQPKNNMKNIQPPVNIKPTNVNSNFIITKPSPPKKIIYQNIILKNALLKHNVPSSKIDATMQKMKITQKTPVTKELINNFLKNLN